MEIRKLLADEIIKWVKEQNITQAEISKIFGLTQPRVSNLMNYRLENFSTEALMDCLHKAGYDIRTKTDDGKLAITMINI